MVETDRVLNVIIALGIIGVFAYASVAMLDAAHSSDDSAQAVELDDAVLLDGTGSFVDVGADLGTGENQTVRNSRNFSMRFTGASDSYLQSDADFDVAAGKNWTVGTGVWINDSAVAESNMTVVAAGDPDVILRYENESGTANWSAYVLNTQTYVANVSAVDPTNATYVFITREGDDVTIHRYNATDSETGESVNVSGTDTVAVNLAAGQHLNGRLDETRTFNSSLDASQRQAIANDPIIPLTNATRTGRIMYDAGAGTDVRIYWAAASATASNATYADGYEGVVLVEGGDPIIGSPTGDYEWDTDGPELKPLAGGRIAGAPVAFATYDFKPFRYQFIVEILDVWDLLPTIMLVLVVSLALAAFRRIQNDVR